MVTVLEFLAVPTVVSTALGYFDSAPTRGAINGLLVGLVFVALYLVSLSRGSVSAGDS